MLLILTSESDLTADFLIVELIKRGLPYFRLNAEELAAADFTFALDQDGNKREVSTASGALNLREVTAVWYRRAIQPNPTTDLPLAERIFVAGELRHLAMGLVLNPEVLWVNPIAEVSVAEHKIYQLQIAQQLGFRIPRTLVSRNPVALRHFIKENTSGTICKPIYHGLFVDEMASYSVYTRQVTEDSIDTESVRACPVLLQEEIPRIADVRATFIGPKCFVADIKADIPIVDWRDPDILVKYSPTTLGTDEEAKCRAMLAKLGLKYGAFDFVRTPDGELVFLEVNPTGEWAWLEDRLGFPMRDAFIQLFFGGSDAR
jgi:hypothetical protein